MHSSPEIEERRRADPRRHGRSGGDLEIVGGVEAEAAVGRRGYEGAGIAVRRHRCWPRKGMTMLLRYEPLDRRLCARRTPRIGEAGAGSSCAIFTMPPPSARRWSRIAGGACVDRSQVFLRSGRLRIVRRHLRTARVLPNPHRGRHLRARIARTSSLRRARASNSSTWAPATAARRRRGCPGCRRAAMSRSTSREAALAVALARIAAEQPSHRRRRRRDRFHARGLDLHRDLAARPATFFYPGSSIGNFDPDAAERFLRSIRRHCRVAAGQRPADRRRHAEGSATAASAPPTPMPRVSRRHSTAMCSTT